MHQIPVNDLAAILDPDFKFSKILVTIYYWGFRQNPNPGGP